MAVNNPLIKPYFLVKGGILGGGGGLSGYPLWIPMISGGSAWHWMASSILLGLMDTSRIIPRSGYFEDHPKVDVKMLASMVI